MVPQNGTYLVLASGRLSDLDPTNDNYWSMRVVKDTTTVLVNKFGAHNDARVNAADHQSYAQWIGYLPYNSSIQIQFIVGGGGTAPFNLYNDDNGWSEITLIRLGP